MPIKQPHLWSKICHSCMLEPFGAEAYLPLFLSVTCVLHRLQSSSYSYVWVWPRPLQISHHLYFIRKEILISGEFNMTVQNFSDIACCPENLKIPSLPSWQNFRTLCTLHVDGSEQRFWRILYSHRSSETTAWQYRGTTTCRQDADCWIQDTLFQT